MVREAEPTDALAVSDGPEQAWVERALLGEAETVAQRHRCTAIDLTRPGIAATAPPERLQELGYVLEDPEEVRLAKTLTPPEPIRI